jgi:hypothetical protein
MKEFTKKEIMFIAPRLNAYGFETWCNENKIDVIWLDVTLSNYNDGYYNVDLPKYKLNICYYDGELEEINEL